MSFFNFEKVVVGTALSTNTIEKFIEEYQSCVEVPQHNVGDFVVFKNCRDTVESVTMLNAAPQGAQILIREHYTVDIHCTKYQGSWFITNKYDRRGG